MAFRRHPGGIATAAKDGVPGVFRLSGDEQVYVGKVAEAADAKTFLTAWKVRPTDRNLELDFPDDQGFTVTITSRQEFAAIHIEEHDRHGRKVNHQYFKDAAAMAAEYGLEWLLEEKK